MQSFYKRYGVSPEGCVLCLDQSDPQSYGDLTNWYDLSSKANHGVQATAGNQPVIGGKAGLSGMARTFDGLSDYISCGNAVSLQISTSNLSILFWINCGPGTRSVPLSHYDGSGVGWYIQLQEIAANGVYWRPAGDELDVGVTLLNEWHFISLAQSGTNVSIYADGAYVGQLAGCYETTGITNDFIIGQQIETNFSDESLTIVSLFNRVLSAGEMQNFYNATRQRFGK